MTLSALKTQKTVYQSGHTPEVRPTHRCKQSITLDGAKYPCLLNIEHHGMHDGFAVHPVDGNVVLW
jgi:hypothetical protein